MHRSTSRLILPLLTVLALLVLSACGSGSSGSGGNQASAGPVKVTLWVRSAIGNFSTNLVKAYNASHKNQVVLTVIPNDNYVQRVGAAAGSNTLPDMLASDVVFFPNFATKHVFADLTDRVNALPYKDALTQAHIKAASVDGRIYGVPSSVDGSALFWNKDLFRRAGLDPDKPPATYQEVIDDAKKIAKLGKGVYGFHFGGNCGGCSIYTMFPMVWASGGAPMSDDGRNALFNSQQWRDLFGMYHQLWADGSAAPQSKNENGNTWAATFGSGKIGISPLGSGLINVVHSTNPKLDFGVAPLPSADGSQHTTFVGGDVVGITASSKHADAAWEYIQWTLSDQVQRTVVVKNGDLAVRTDLPASIYADPRQALIAGLLKQGRTPFALPMNQVYNNPGSPWVLMFRKAIFDGDVDGALTQGQQTIDGILKQAS
jgi:multiple sugar transport system substrate-binding protein